MPKKKVTVQVEEEDYAKIRARLILEGKTFSSWLRELIKNVINE